jgi:hypothetical protein
MNRIKFALFIFVIAALAGCTGGGIPGAPSAPPAALHYDANNCQYYQLSGGNTVPGLYCVRPVAEAHVPTWDFYLAADPAKKPSFRQVFAPGNDAYAVQYWYSTERWTRSLADGTGDVEYCWRPSGNICEWVTPAGFQQRLDEQVQAQALGQEQAEATRLAAEQAAATNRAVTEQQLNELNQRQIEAGKIFTAPDCDWSRNGCFP